MTNAQAFDIPNQEFEIPIGRIGDVDDCGSRLKKALGEKSNAWLAKQVGVVASTVHGYVHGKIPPADVALRICDVLNIDIRWYIEGKGAEAPSADDLVDVPFLDRGGNVTQGGAGYARRLLEDLVGDPFDARCIIATGASMEPTVPEHSEVLFALGAEVVDGMVHVVRIRDRLVLRRIRIGTDGHPVAICDNPAFAREDAEPVSDGQILGRVVWVGHRA